MNLSALSASFQPQAQGGSARISAAQSTKLQEVLSNYDPETLTSKGAAEIVAQIKELGIQPGRELAQELKSAGFDPKELREAAGASGNRPPPPPPADETALNVLSDILEDYDLNALSQEDETDILSKLADKGINLSYNNNKIVDISA